MDFARVLLVGVVIFAALMIFFGGEFVGIGGNTQGGGYRFGNVSQPQEEEEPEPEEAEVPQGNFFVGRKEDIDYKYFDLSRDPFSVSFGKREIILGNLDRIRVEKGFMKDSPQLINFNLTKSEIEKTDSLQLSFYVRDTNSLGKLLIDLNGNRAFSRFVKPGKEYSVDLNTSLLNTTNEIKIHPQSSGTRFWAPTVYVLRNFTARANILKRSRKTFEFTLEKEKAANFKSGRIVLRPEEFEAFEPLGIRINGQEVYNEITEMPSRPSIWVEFNESVMETGTNKLTLVTGYNSSYKFNSGQLIVFWATDKAPITNKTVSVSSGNHSSLPGEISFKINRIEKSPSSLTMRIISGGEVLHKSIYNNFSEGKTISIDITKDDIAKGENTIQFEIGGKGGFYLSNFKIDY